MAGEDNEDGESARQAEVPPPTENEEQRAAERGCKDKKELPQKRDAENAKEEHAANVQQQDAEIAGARGGWGKEGG